ncbi:efflux RND transporter periplasmic adaptor subunit [Mucilaginibacter inviolabilis]|uniref:efflux RND transporter periplasmic adaptor subunit n=1 Tax=Mucilaginibacter inviolabilis TaxID=2714892 RepID=UPI001F1FE33B|nr:efflux RND transporter periplasmic adaptor subunit [Mucilaginibacter inviolabilis]
MRSQLSLILCLFLFACKNHQEKIHPSLSSISESVYASGSLKSGDQYQAFASVSGVIQKRFVEVGDQIYKGSPILLISREAQQLNKENAELSAVYTAAAANQGKLKAARQEVETAHDKMVNDSVLLARQRILWRQDIGTKVQLEDRELAAKQSQTTWYTACVNLKDLQRQINFNAAQSRNNLQLSRQLENDFILRSNLDGKVYALYKENGESVNPQTPLALLGRNNGFLLEMQVDEYDIARIAAGQRVLVTMDSYKGQVFEAVVTKLYPAMNDHSKTFLVEAAFTRPPAKLFPNTTLEANIIIRTKKNALLIPRSCLMNDSTVLLSGGKSRTIKTGLSDYNWVEVLAGLKQQDEILNPMP